MNILLVGMHFGNYELKMKEEFEKQGNRVVLIHSLSKWDTFFRRILSSKLIAKNRHNYQLKQLSKIELINLDVVIVIVGRELCVEFYQELQKKSKARIILYLWDDVKRVKNFNDIREYVSEVLSFDPIDAYKFGFRFLPLFYTNEFYPVECEKLLDIYSAMSNHSDRLHIVKMLYKKYSKIMQMSFFINTGRLAYIKCWIQNVKARESDGIRIISKPISKEKNKQYMDQSKSLLDIPFEGQIGLTIRTLEALGNQTKLITTNKSIRYYDFYDENNICILDKINPRLDEKFIKGSYEKNDSEMRMKYSLESWCKAILGIESYNYLVCDLKKIYTDLFG